MLASFIPQQGCATLRDLIRAPRVGAAVLFVLLLAPQALAQSTVTEIPLPPDARGPIAIEPDAQGRLWVTLHETWGVARYDSRTNETVIVNLTIPKVREIYSLVGLEVAPDGIVWILSTRHIHRLDPARMEVEAFPMPVEDAKLPGALHLRPDGSLWASLVGRGVVVRFDTATHEMEVFEVPGELQGPLEFADVGDEMLVTLTYQGTYARFDPATGRFAKQPRDLFLGPQAILVDGRDVWVAEHGGTSLARHEPGDDRVERFPTTRGRASPLAGPSDLLRAEDGALWFVEHLGDRLGRFDPADRTLVEFDLVSDPYTNTQLFTQTPDGVVWAAVEANDTLARVEYGGERPSFTLPERVEVAAGEAVRVPVDLRGEAAFGATDLGLALRYEEGGVVISPELALAPGTYRIVVSEKNGLVSAGRFMDVHVTGGKATPLPALAPVVALGVVLLVRKRTSARA